MSAIRSEAPFWVACVLALCLWVVKWLYIMHVAHSPRLTEVYWVQWFYR